MIRPKAEKNWGFCVKIVWTTLRKRSKNMFFAGENRISKRKTSKFSRLRRGYTPSSPKIFRACGAATTQAIIQIIIIQMTFFEK